MPASSPPKVVTRNLAQGDILLKPSEKLKSIYLIQSGRIALCQHKNGRLVEIAQLTSGRALGDEAVFGATPWTLTALALRPSVLLEIPLPSVAEPMNLAPPWMKSVLKALAERMKASFADLRNLQVSREAVSCPSDHVAKVFGVIFHGARILGKLSDGDSTAQVNWAELREFCHEVFGEPIVRIEDAATILAKLGYARFEGAVLHLSEMKKVEAFFDYYGSYHFKGGYDDLLKTNSKIQKVTEEFLKIADAFPVDRGGQAHLPYKKTIDALKKVMGSNFEADQLFRIEQKGLFLKRTATQDGGMLSFYRADFDQMMLNWSFLRELELWNEKGFVEALAQEVPTGGVAANQPHDPHAERKKWAHALEKWKPVAIEQKSTPKLRKGEKAKDELWCSVCMSVVTREQKMCPVCGADIDSNKAA